MNDDIQRQQYTLLKTMQMFGVMVTQSNGLNHSQLAFILLLCSKESDDRPVNQVYSIPVVFLWEDDCFIF
ncbi:unnamed protein product [Absidia cylindrospora]